MFKTFCSKVVNVKKNDLYDLKSLASINNNKKARSVLSHLALQEISAVPNNSNYILLN
jgi:hypothetical protein